MAIVDTNNSIALRIVESATEQLTDNIVNLILIKYLFIALNNEYSQTGERRKWMIIN